MTKFQAFSFQNSQDEYFKKAQNSKLLYSLYLKNNKTFDPKV